jgi:hypothetical protein
MKGGCAPLTSPYPPGLSWRHIKRRSDTGSSRIPSRLAHRARPIRQYRADATLSRLLPPSPAIPRIRLPPAPAPCCDSGPMDGLSPPSGQTALCSALPQVPPVGDLNRLGRAAVAAIGVDPGTVPADHLRSWPGDQPLGEQVRRAVVEDVDRAAGPPPATRHTGQADLRCRYPAQRPDTSSSSRIAVVISATPFLVR